MLPWDCVGERTIKQYEASFWCDENRYILDFGGGCMVCTYNKIDQNIYLKCVLIIACKLNLSRIFFFFLSVCLARNPSTLSGRESDFAPRKRQGSTGT